jgi:hypothetical protein
MSWSEKYKKSINCDNPKGFSQRAHCQGRNKKVQEQTKSDVKYPKFTHKTPHLKGKQHQLDPDLDLKQLVHHATVQYVDKDADGDVDIFDKKKTPDENPVANFATVSKTLMKKQKGEMQHSKQRVAYEGNLHQWFKDSKSKDGKPGWVNVVTGDTCASDKPGEGIPKCVSSSKRASMSKKERRAAAAAKRREDPGQQKKSGAAKPTMVKTDRTKKEGFEMTEAKDKKGSSSGEKDACYHKVKSRYSVWPSAYASGALVKCRKVGAANWGNKKEGFTYEFDQDYHKSLVEKCWVGYTQKGMKKKGDKMVPNCVPEQIDASKYGKSPDQLLQDIVDKKKLGGKVEKYGLKKANEEVEIQEKVERYNELGQTVAVTLRFRGKIFYLQLFFPTIKFPNRKEVETQVQKIYPDAVVMMAVPATVDPTKPTIRVAEGKEYQVGETIPASATKPKSKPTGASKYKFSVDKTGLKGPEKPFAEEVLPDGPDADKRNPQKPKRKTQGGDVRPGVDVKEGAAWTKKSGKNPSGGLNEKGRKSYERENPGSDLKAPSKKVGNKRRASFCARMTGMKKKLTSAKTANDPDSRINKSLRAWNC